MQTPEVIRGNVSFEATGCQPIDGILRAVASASKMYHNTSDWYDNCLGVCHVRNIQEAADKAAASHPSPSPDLQGELVAALRELVFSSTHQCPDYHRSTIEAARAILAKLPAETTNQEG